MNELDPKDRAILDAALAVEGPGEANRDRVRSAVIARVGAGAFASAIVSSAASGSAKAALGASLTKGLLGLTVAASVAAFAFYVAERSGSDAAAVPASVGLATAVRQSVPPAPAAEAPPESDVQAAPSASVAAQASAEPRGQGRPKHDLEAELDLISQAQAALRRGDAAAAGSLLDQHAQRFPRGQFAQEREGMRLIVLCNTGSAGKAEAERFIRAKPGSALSKRIRKACGLP